jgi:hypothetical protein
MDGAGSELCLKAGFSDNGKETGRVLDEKCLQQLSNFCGFIECSKMDLFI